ncbi:hypothetical protein TWF788_002681 [Orbilia oligospora]|uniref:Uncharacterized protein n=1 Tax=Orbilia oligospora TaxID=2813651 RepID=A0A7C8U434_ORBOL|nr:hypothetical protein TWF788_002681 [Orbilia oligospora]
MGIFFEERCSRTVGGIICLGFFDDNNVCDRCSKPSEEPVQQPPLSQPPAGTQSSGSQGSSSSKITSVAPNQTKPTNDYLDWPNYQVWPYPDLKELLERLGKVDNCKVEIFRSTGNDGARWFRCKSARKPVKSFETLLSLLKSEVRLVISTSLRSLTDDKASGDHCLE